MGAAGLRRFRGPRVLAEGEALLQPGAALEVGKTTRTLGPAGAESAPARKSFATENAGAFAHAATAVLSGTAPVMQPDHGNGTATARRSHESAVLESWVAADPLSVRLLQEVRGIAGSGSTVLVRGESGTGKDLLAWLIHYLGPRNGEPLVKIHCASL